MVTMQTFDVALKDIYEEPTKDQINIGSGVFLSKVEQTSRDIEGGRRVYKIAPYGVNGGTGSGADTQALPVAGGNNYVPFISTLKSIRGVIRFTDQVMKASRSIRAAFESAMQSEQDGLLKSLKHTYGRQTYLDGTGICAMCDVNTATTTLVVDTTQYLIEGMTIDIVDPGTGVAVQNGTQRRIASVVRTGPTRSITLVGAAAVTTAGTEAIVEQGSWNQELTGMEAVYAQAGTLYGLNKALYPWLVPFVNNLNGNIEDQAIVDTINFVEEYRGSNINLIIANPAVESEYYKYLEATKRSVDSETLEGGYKALKVCGRPMSKDRFVRPGSMKLLDTTQWKMHTMDGGDWSWLDEDGKILKWVSGFAMWEAAMIKYCELICDHPGGQAEIANITTTSNLFN
jgi:hypothetical protein